MITLTGLCFGLSSIRFAFENQYELGVACILIAAVCDTLDGFFARMLKSSSELGAQLDSLSDFLCFGIANICFSLFYVSFNYICIGFTKK